ncbi:MAG: 4-(cytidine 5'-diphospho)-2-C-methyl-D-erythritol kinase [Alphaproteobacteria bacterium]|nr:4-(cytidine 5'-diphospho)-2-C-methyl-D-erythritol kinase [Alphaproteobacteria bacterium]
MRVAAPAKINLYLHVLARRADGYHELDSLVAFADIADTVEVRAASGLSLAIEGPFGGALRDNPGDNLVLRAARRLAERAGIAADAALTLIKRLPVASGIGGGSSDAAATLRGLCRLWRLSVPDAALAELAGALGADVPVCLFGRPAWVGGVGSDIESAPELPPLGIVLANPAVALATPAVFQARRGAFSSSGRFAERPRDTDALIASLASRRNDLTEAAIGIVPEIAQVLQALQASPGMRLARMSGSGATCFALYQSREAARHAAAELAATRPGWWIAAGALAPNAPEN